MTAASKGFRVEVRDASDNRHYLFTYVTIDPSVTSGKYRFEVKGPSGRTT